MTWSITTRKWNTVEVVVEPFTFIVTLDRLRLSHPADFTDTVVFRRCPGCGERNIVRDDDFTCALCASPLPPQWNFTPE